MKRLFVISVLFIFCLANNAAFAGDFSSGENSTGLYLTPSKFTETSFKYFNMSKQDDQDTTSQTREEQLAQLPGYKLPKKALFFSALIPGAGELYVKSYMKAAAFFLVEVGAWTYYATYNQKGKDKESEYEAYADANWDPLKWENWYAGVPEEKKDFFTHTEHMIELLHAGTKTQQYYEMIGKYAEFVVGWKGADEELLYEDLLDYRRNDCAIADDYMDMRYDSNQLFDKAKTGITISMFNHLLSAVDAAWTAKKYNNRLIETSFRVEPIYYVDHMQPVFSFKVSW